jgi:hypothetical protein
MTQTNTGAGIWSWQLVDGDTLKADAVVIVCLVCTGTCDGWPRELVYPAAMRVKARC